MSEQTKRRVPTFQKHAGDMVRSRDAKIAALADALESCLGDLIQANPRCVRISHYRNALKLAKGGETQMTTAQKHTPTPWRAVDGRYTAVGISHMTDGEYGKPYQVAAIYAADKMCRTGERCVAVINGKSTGEIDADAQMIVRAVNSHAALVGALQGVIDQECTDGEEATHMHDMADIARAALKLAKVEA